MFLNLTFPRKRYSACTPLTPVSAAAQQRRTLIEEQALKLTDHEIHASAAPSAGNDVRQSSPLDSA